MCWQGEPEHLQFLQQGQFCLLNLSGNQGLQATPDCTNIHVHGHSDRHILPNKLETWKGQRYHGIQMRAFKLETQPEEVRKATLHCLQQAALSRDITHLSTNSSRLFFYIQQKQVRWAMYMQKLLLAVLCGQCWLHVSHLPHLLPPTEPTGISIWTPHCCWQHRHSKMSNFSPAATGAPGTVPALISAHTGHVLFTVSKCSETFNLPKDCPLVCPHRRGMKLVIIKKEKTSYSSFSSLLCEEHAQLKWYQQRQIPWAFSGNTKGSEQGTTLQGPDPWMGQDMMKCPNMPFLSMLLAEKSGFKSSDLVLHHFRFCTQKSWKITSSTGKSNFWLTYLKLLRITVYWYSHRGSQQHRMPH